ncbi:MULTISPECIES: hypothetical protein [Bradyrhizobium]|uniref:hypothetical protein n=1 Tax=Bradyrhizobium TaxID=374 RepID=UPI002ACDCC41|nr:hypothetical protein [Bradyrhizobium sp. SEMIA]
MVWAWLVELFEVVVVPVPELDDWPAADCPVEDRGCVCAEFEGLVCEDPDDVLLVGVDADGDGVEVDDES